jgi:DNA-binding transcriptional LysR family regulator
MTDVTSLTLRQLACFVATCDAGGVSPAARRLHLAQPTVSAALADLERTLGVQLLVRAPARGAVPSPAGRELLAGARATLAAATAVEAHAREVRGAVAGELTVACLVTLAAFIGPRVCRAFEDAWPEASAQIVPVDQEGLLRHLRTGVTPIALTYDLGLGDDVAFQPLVDYPPYALVAPGHPLAERRSVDLATLASSPLVLLDLPFSGDYFVDLFRDAGLEPLITRRVPDPELGRSLVAHGYGYTLANVRPAPTRAVDGAPLIALPLRGLVRPAVLGLAQLAGARPTRAIEAFAETCVAALGEA